MGQDADPFHNLRRAILHQAIVSGDIGFAFRSIDNQSIDFIAAAAQFCSRGEASAAQTGNAKLVDALNQFFTRLVVVVAPAVALDPAVFAIGVDNNAEFRQRGRVGGGMGGNSRHRSGSRGMNRQHSAKAAGQRLTAQNFVARLYAQFAFSADMLLQRNDKTLRQRNLTQRRTVGLSFHLRRVNTAVEVPDLVFSKSGK